jgi:hypothetical protein
VCVGVGVCTSMEKSKQGGCVEPCRVEVQNWRLVGKCFLLEIRIKG